jgi:hypothetical protein
VASGSLPLGEYKDHAMEIESTTFGTITIDGKTYEHDVLIRLSGEVVKRKKKLSKKYYGTSHVLSKEEAKFVFERGCDEPIVGSGQVGNVRLSLEAAAFFKKKDCKVLLQPTPDAGGTFEKCDDFRYLFALGEKWTFGEVAATSHLDPQQTSKICSGAGARFEASGIAAALKASLHTKEARAERAILFRQSRKIISALKFGVTQGGRPQPRPKSPQFALLFFVT